MLLLWLLRDADLLVLLQSMQRPPLRRALGSSLPPAALPPFAPRRAARLFHPAQSSTSAVSAAGRCFVVVSNPQPMDSGLKRVRCTAAQATRPALPHLCMGHKQRSAKMDNGSELELHCMRWTVAGLQMTIRIRWIQLRSPSAARWSGDARFSSHFEHDVLVESETQTMMWILIAIRSALVMARKKSEQFLRQRQVKHGELLFPHWNRLSSALSIMLCTSSSFEHKVYCAACTSAAAIFRSSFFESE